MSIITGVFNKREAIIRKPLKKLRDAKGRRAKLSAKAILPVDNPLSPKPNCPSTQMP